LSETETSAALRHLPKVELHLHLEGAIPHDTLWELVQEYGGDPAVPDRGALERKLRFTDFARFLEAWGWKNRYLRQYDDFTLIAEAAARKLAEQNILYAEVLYSPPDFRQHGLKPQTLTESIRQGLDRVPEATVNLVADLVRDFGPEAAERTLGEVAEVRGLGVVGVGIGGTEPRYPPEPFAAVFEKARDLGFKTSAHAGEAAGPQSIWGAIRGLRVDRIGHGTRAAEDPDLVRQLKEHSIPLEMCPLSNVRTGAVDSIRAHPIADFFRNGLCVTVSTDDPEMFNNTLAGEFETLMDTFGFTLEDIGRLTLNAVKACWLPEKEKSKLKEKILGYRDDCA
jgi:adenosine deaminase